MADFFSIGLELPSALLTNVCLVLNLCDIPTPMAGRELYSLAVLVGPPSTSVTSVTSVTVESSALMSAAQ